MNDLEKSARLARDLNALLSMDYSVADALSQIGRAQTPGEWATNLRKAEDAARSGASLGQALKSAGGFPPQLVQGLSQSDLALTRVALLLEQTAWRERQLQAALAYPALLLTAALALVWLVYGFLGRDFAGAMAGFSVELPFFAKLAKGVGTIVSNPLFITGEILLIAAVFGAVAGWGPLAGLRMRLPILGGWLRRLEAASWLAWLDQYLASGLSLPVAVREAGEVCSDPGFRSGVKAVALRIEKGDQLGQALEKETLLPDLAQWMVKQGELQEFAPGYLGEVSATLQREIQSDSERATAWVEMGGLLLLLLVVPPAILGFLQPMYLLIGNLG